MRREMRGEGSRIRAQAERLVMSAWVAMGEWERVEAEGEMKTIMHCIGEVGWHVIYLPVQPSAKTVSLVTRFGILFQRKT